MRIFTGSSLVMLAALLVFFSYTPAQADFVSVPGLYSCIANCSDFDCDGEWEILYLTSSGVFVFNPDGTPKTAGMPNFQAGDYRVPPGIGHFDDDGIDDIVTVRRNDDYYGNDFIVGYYSGGGSFQYDLNCQVRGIWEYEQYYVYPVVQDVDNDGIDEIFIVDGTRKRVVDCKIGRQNVIYQDADAFIPADLDGDGIYNLYAFDDYVLRQYDYNWNNGVSIDVKIGNTDPQFWSGIMSVFDVDDDGDDELIFLAAYETGDPQTAGYYLWAFDENLNTVWCRYTTIPSFDTYATNVRPTHPVFGDIDGAAENDPLEYIITFYDTFNAFVYAWNIDGTTYKAGTPLFSDVPFPASLSQALLTDIDGDGAVDVVASACNSYVPVVSGQWLMAWGADGQFLNGYPLQISTSGYVDFMFTPMVNDFDQDGDVDLVLPTQSGLYMTSFENVDYDTDNTPVSMYRYHRSFDGVGPSFGDGYLCGDANHDWLVGTGDIDYIIDYVFRGGPAPQPYASGNVNCDGSVNVSDAVYLINYFKGGPAPCDCERRQAKAFENDNNILPLEFSLGRSYPNPFNPSTAFSYSVPRAAHVNIAVYNILGRKVTDLVDQVMSPGQYEVVWNGTDEHGQTVVSGIYFTSMRSGDFVSTRKMLLLK